MLHYHGDLPGGEKAVLPGARGAEPGSRSLLRPQELRRLAGQFVTGVAVVTTCDQAGRPYGITVNSVTCLSLRPPLYLVCLDRESNTLPPLLDSGLFGINFLDHRQRGVSDRCAGKDSDKFRDIDWTLRPPGVPVLPDVLAFAGCRVSGVFPGGDHLIITGNVESCSVSEGQPLVFYQGRYWQQGGFE